MHENAEVEPSVLEYATAMPAEDVARSWWPPVASILLDLLVAPLFMCICGHLDRVALAATLPACILAGYGWITNGNRDLLWRCFLMAAVVLSVLLLLKNVGDVLWLGHNPVLN